MKKLISMLLALVMVFGLAACGSSNANEAAQTTAEVTTAPAEDAAEELTDVTALGEGATSFIFTVVDADGTETKFQINTDASTVGEALLALELISGDDSEYGLYVKEVNGITADWDVDQSYWAFYINGEYALTGVDSTEINPDNAYSFVKTVSEAAVSDVTVLGEGATVFTVVTTDLDGEEATSEIHTDAATVGEALVALELIEGHDTEYGLYVDAVNGIALDWDKDGKYWAFYIDGEYALTGVDSTEAADGAIYTFKAE